MGSRDVLVDLTFTLLLVFGPKPQLIGRHRERRPEFDDPIVALQDFHPGAWVVQVQPTTQVAGQSDQTAGL